jgi:signal transduction histidine kinase
MRRRILAAIVGVSAVAVVILGVPLGIAVQRLYRNEELVRLEREAAEATRVVNATSIGSGDPIELPSSSSTLQLAVYDRQGRLLAGRGPARADAVVEHALRGSVTDARSAHRLTVAVPVARQEEVAGAIRASAASSVVTDRAVRAWLVMAGIGVAAVGVAALIGVWLTRRLTAPVKALARDARRLGDGDFASPSTKSGVAELDAVADALDATGERLGQVLARERAFTADASHQLRTPLAALRVQLEAALMTPGADLDGAVRSALPELDRVEQTIDDLLALARDAHDTAEPLDVQGVLDEIEGDWRGRLAALGRPLVVRSESEFPEARASRVAIRQVLDVLVDNAMRHGAGPVEVRARPAPGGLVIEVTDEGLGVAGDPEAIFARRVGRGTSHGIGLALARSLAEADGGRLVLERARPEPRFALILPTEGGERPDLAPSHRTHM